MVSAIETLLDGIRGGADTRRLSRVDLARVAIAALSLAPLTACSAAIDPATIIDAQTAARVKTALVNDPEVGAFPIEVRVVGGVAALSGRVRSQDQVDRAVALARSVQGVTGVNSNLRIGGEPPPVASGPPNRGGSWSEDPPEIGTVPGLLAVGAALGWSVPGAEALKTHVSVSPLIKLGSPRGLGPAVGFDWFRADLESVGAAATLTRVHVKPLMAGAGYTLLADRLSLTPSIVAGYAFNSLTVTDTGLAQGLPVEVRNSFVWRVGASAWYDVSRRVVLNASIGYLMTELRLTVLDGARLERREASGDTALVQVGLAYRLF